MGLGVVWLRHAKMSCYFQRLIIIMGFLMPKKPIIFCTTFFNSCCFLKLSTLLSYACFCLYCFGTDQTISCSDLITTSTYNNIKLLQLQFFLCLSPSSFSWLSHSFCHFSSSFANYRFFPFHIQITFYFQGMKMKKKKMNIHTFIKDLKMLKPSLLILSFDLPDNDGCFFNACFFFFVIRYPKNRTV